MCNACGLQCCASDQLRECGCDGCTLPGCWERCPDCGDVIDDGYCLCGDPEDDEGEQLAYMSWP